jgi:hypothetical protein
MENSVSALLHAVECEDAGDRVPGPRRKRPQGRVADGTYDRDRVGDFAPALVS